MSHGSQHLKKTAFLATFAKLGNVTAAAEAVGINRCTHYDWLKTDPAYPGQFADANDSAADHLETEAWRRAKEGVVRYKFHQGEPILHPETGGPYYELEYSDTLLIFLLKGLRPEKYRENVKAAPEGPEVLARRLKEALKSIEETDGE